jgi:hypothetical protein
MPFLSPALTSYRDDLVLPSRAKRKLLPADTNDLMWDKADLQAGEDILRTEGAVSTEITYQGVNYTHFFKPKYFIPSLTCMS